MSVTDQALGGCRGPGPLFRRERPRRQFRQRQILLSWVGGGSQAT